MPRTHRMSGTSEYVAWLKIKQRVFDENDKNFKVYSLLGMADEFRYDFMAFYNHIGPKPKDGKWSVDRIDNTKGYVRGNIQWADDFTQARNRRKKITNTSGFTGVYWRTKRGHTYAIADCSDDVRVEKCFSVNKYGLLPAFAMACAYRERMIEQLNEKGAGYAANHGK